MEAADEELTPLASARRPSEEWRQLREWQALGRRNEHFVLRNGLAQSADIKECPAKDGLMEATPDIANGREHKTHIIGRLFPSLAAALAGQTRFELREAEPR